MSPLFHHIDFLPGELDSETDREADMWRDLALAHAAFQKGSRVSCPSPSCFTPDPPPPPAPPCGTLWFILFFPVFFFRIKSTIIFQWHLVNPPVESGARARKARNGQGQRWDRLVMERASFSPGRRAPARRRLDLEHPLARDSRGRRFALVLYPFLIQVVLCRVLALCASHPLPIPRGPSCLLARHECF
jgi:hypothetical protein